MVIAVLFRCICQLVFSYNKRSLCYLLQWCPLNSVTEWKWKKSQILQFHAHFCRNFSELFWTQVACVCVYHLIVKLPNPLLLKSVENLTNNLTVLFLIATLWNNALCHALCNGGDLLIYTVWHQIVVWTRSGLSLEIIIKMWFTLLTEVT